jgi:anhydro-N-acetylmuramic acid kinase
VIAFDTGPANCISDWLCRTHDPMGMSYDVDGMLASRGRIVDEIVDEFLADSYFSKPAPKSTDGPSMTAAFERAAGDLSRRQLNDLLATATFITAVTVSDAIAALPARPDEVIASGGGTHNKAMMGWFRSRLEDLPVRLLSDEGMFGDAKEAVAFALLGAATLDGEPSNVPSVTGARRRVILGSITPRP